MNFHLYCCIVLNSRPTGKVDTISFSLSLCLFVSFFLSFIFFLSLSFLLSFLLFPYFLFLYFIFSFIFSSFLSFLSFPSFLPPSLPSFIPFLSHLRPLELSRHFHAFLLFYLKMYFFFQAIKDTYRQHLEAQYSLIFQQMEMH